jgi:hypothetical protein
MPRIQRIDAPLPLHLSLGQAAPPPLLAPASPPPLPLPSIASEPQVLQEIAEQEPPERRKAIPADSEPEDDESVEEPTKVEKKTVKKAAKKAAKKAVKAKEKSKKSKKAAKGDSLFAGLDGKALVALGAVGLGAWYLLRG